ncbi:hypothetical protein [Mycobacterium sp. M23085]|uniref:hypothetical protein n=1 Tax=Mycobacterium sp. M23085 TaxID=3378087 RepID=UPI00387803FC
MSHSLVRDHSELLNDLASGTIKVQIQFNAVTREATHQFSMELPPEEAFESFAARVRPFTIPKEPVYWAVVLDALEGLVSEDTLANIIDLEDLREHWKTVVEGKKIAQAFYVVTEKGQLSDVQLADMWLNSDALHTQLIQSEIGKELSLDQRYRAATGVYARLGSCVNATYYLVKYLVQQGLLELDPEVFTVPVLAKTSVEIKGQVYSAELGTEMPTDLSNLDPKIWRPIHEDIELLGEPEGGLPEDGSLPEPEE